MRARLRERGGERACLVDLFLYKLKIQRMLQDLSVQHTRKIMRSDIDRKWGKRDVTKDSRH